ncbi:hypothetical protein CB0940_08167 [Cercospora beticola]|uniref:Uncharacterized protein n=1 Tax=Cercospora beticola TaxID=122368 RepID=A0A2G5HQT0_CERBT|nr:hypothetical protein CB0940_08167 [Cercospora beticola]PIA94592.1 hypothetical protein CB0940_08167 [Cercospora beticola]WPB04734.1 hypothetical protein RHO25_009381 [Cercospora beticola]
MSYKVYTIERLGMSSLNHVALFVETETDGGGLVFHVTGNILSGMKYEKEVSDRPDNSASFIAGTQRLIETLQKSKLSDFESACESVPIPGAQLKLNGTPKHPWKPIRRCGEWVEDAKAKVIADGILLVGSTEHEWLVLL